MNQSPYHVQQTFTAAPPRRPVNVLSGSRSSRIRTQCDVKGSLCFTRPRSIGGNSRMLRIFNLTSPVSFASGVVAYGLDAKMLRIMQSDERFSTAVTALLMKGYRLSLGGQKLELNLVGKVPAEFRESLSNDMEAAAACLEALTAGMLNSAASLASIRRPWVTASTVSVVLFFVSHLASKLSISAFSLLPAIIAGSVLLSVGAFFVLRSGLWRYELAGAAAFDVLMLGIFSSVFFSSAVCIVLNDYVGSKVLPPRDFSVQGVVHITHGKRTYCALVLDASTPVVVNDKRMRTLPMPCALATSRNDSLVRPYDVAINPGLLGAAFVQSFMVSEPPLAGRSSN